MLITLRHKTSANKGGDPPPPLTMEGVKRFNAWYGLFTFNFIFLLLFVDEMDVKLTKLGISICGRGLW